MSIFLKTIKRIKLLEEEHARHQIICNPELHSGLYGRKLTRRAQPRRTATKRRKISSNQNKEFNSEEKPEPIKPLPSHEKYIPPIQVCIADNILYTYFLYGAAGATATTLKITSKFKKKYFRK